MKYIISEHKLDKLIFEVIDGYLKKNRQSFDSFIIYSFEGPDNEDDVTIEYDYEDGRLFIRKNFVMFIADMFGLTPKQSQLKIYEWFTVTEEVLPKFMESPFLEGFWRQDAPRRDEN